MCYSVLSGPQAFTVSHSLSECWCTDHMNVVMNIKQDTESFSLFFFLISNFSDCFKSFLMSKGKFCKSLKDHNTIFASCLNFHACIAAKNLCSKQLVHAALLFCA